MSSEDDEDNIPWGDRIKNEGKSDDEEDDVPWSKRLNSVDMVEDTSKRKSNTSASKLKKKRKRDSSDDEDYGQESDDSYREKVIF